MTTDEVANQHPSRMDRLMHAVAEHHPITARMDLEIDGFRVCIESNSEPLVDALSDYFRKHLCDRGDCNLCIVAIEAPPPELDLPFLQWERDPGKVGRKEEYIDIDGGRVVRKVKTGMQFMLGADLTLAVGRCLQNQNQLVNLVNARYIEHLIEQGFLLCHAAGVARGDAGIALCGISGAGKSTLALQLVSRGANFVSNDRLLLRQRGAGLEMAGVPKSPRVNPGTILGNPDLHGILSPERLRALSSMSRVALWTLEEKYDADIEDLYGPGRVQPRAALHALVVLRWQPGSSDATVVTRTTLGQRPDLVPIVAKHPGPFYRGRVPTQPHTSSVHALDPSPYLEQLSDLPVVELSGAVDFERAIGLCEALLENPSPA